MRLLKFAISLLDEVAEECEHKEGLESISEDITGIIENFVESAVAESVLRADEKSRWQPKTGNR